MIFQISRSDFDDSNRIDSKFEILAESANAIPMVSGSKISSRGSRIQKSKNFDFIKINLKSFNFNAISFNFD